MFNGERIEIKSFEVLEEIPGARKRMRARVNGEDAFVKTHGDQTKAALADELKIVMGLPKVGCSVATWEDQEVLVCRYYPGVRKLMELDPKKLDVPKRDMLLRITMFDLWVANNDRNSSNVLVLEDGSLLAIDETAAFKFAQPVTFRLGNPLREALRKPWMKRDPVEEFQFDSLQAVSPKVREIVRRSTEGWAALSFQLMDRWSKLARMWRDFEGAHLCSTEK